jgi:misacylated tRNA(Ala) deacylase
MTIMNPNEGRLQTAEHILARTLEHKFSHAEFVIAKFDDNIGHMEISSETDLRRVDRTMLQAEINGVIGKNLGVNKYIIEREEAEKQFDLKRLPSNVKEVRIVEIEGFDKTPCKDPHVENTSEIGHFEILKVEKAGKDRYRFVFRVQ